MPRQFHIDSRSRLTIDIPEQTPDKVTVSAKTLRTARTAVTDDMTVGQHKAIIAAQKRVRFALGKLLLPYVSDTSGWRRKIKELRKRAYRERNKG